MQKNIINIIVRLLLFVFTVKFGFSQSILLENNLLFDGIRRNFLLYIPDKSDTTTKPLVIALHGGLGSGKDMIRLTKGKFNELADKDHWLVAYPDGIGNNWNDGRKNLPEKYIAHNQNINDTGFLKSLLFYLVANYHADPKRIYLTGMSNGAMMTYRMAMELGNLFAAVAPVCGNIPADIPLNAKHIVPIIIFNGTNDPLVPYFGGDVHFYRKKLGKVLSVTESVTFCLKTNGTDSLVSIDTLRPNVKERAYIVRESFGTKGSKNEVVLNNIINGGHIWPGGLAYFSEKIIGIQCNAPNACDMIWNFFSMHKN